MALPANKTYFTPGPRLLKWITRNHIRLYEGTGGVLGGMLCAFGEAGTPLLRPMPMLVLSTKGWTTGITRKVTLAYFQYDDRVFVVASNAASDQNPAWYTNLLSEPEVRVQIGGVRLRATARSIEGPEYAALWARHTAAWPRWRLYQERTRRQIPMVELCFH
jgi:deazaflavin-dependent oxidoreductase (nitroreductase family)